MMSAPTTDQLIRITSWNVAGKDPLNGTMLDYLFDDSKRVANLKPEIQIVGFQEAPQYLFADPWTTSLTSTLKPRGYVLFKRHKLSGILLYIFVLREIMLQVRDFETESVKTGFGGWLGNKGGVSLRFTSNGNSFCAMNSHLAAHQENLQQRILDYNSILAETRFKVDPNATSVLDQDYSIWFGDLNFRFDDIEKHEVLSIITKARTAKTDEERKNIISALHKNDQLMNTKKKKQAFDGFEETPPTFLPTYKFQIGNKDAYDSENRIPAWTDRILFRNQTLSPEQFKPNLEQLFYDALPETELSDHKPIVSMLKVRTYDPKQFNPSPIPYEVVKFELISGWKADQDGRLWYKISNELFYRRPKVLSSYDRLALYRADFASLEDYLTVIFANNLARISPRLDAQEIAYQSSTSSSRRSSVSSTRSDVSIGTEAISLNDTSTRSSSPARPSTGPGGASSPQIVVNAIPDDAVIGDGFKYFTAVFPDEMLIPGRYVVLYLKSKEDNVYGMSAPFDVLP